MSYQLSLKYPSNTLLLTVDDKVYYSYDTYHIEDIRANYTMFIKSTDTTVYLLNPRTMSKIQFNLETKEMLVTDMITADNIRSIDILNILYIAKVNLDDLFEYTLMDEHQYSALLKLIKLKREYNMDIIIKDTVHAYELFPELLKLTMQNDKLKILRESIAIVWNKLSEWSKKHQQPFLEKFILEKTKRIHDPDFDKDYVLKNIEYFNTFRI